jgi:uncharacterized OB-fold protein
MAQEQAQQRTYRKPIPIPSPETEFFWEKVRQHELWIQRCKDCGHNYFYPRPLCPKCLSRNVEWFKASGRGTLYSYMINHRPAPGFEEEAPYAIAVVQLEEGPRMMTNIVGIENTPEKLVLDMPLEVTFEDVLPEVTIPKWKPASS